MLRKARLLKAAAWVLILMGCAHLVGHLSGIKEMESPSDEKTRTLVMTMRNYTLPDWPHPRSFEGLYNGFSLSMSAYAIFMGSLMLVAIGAAGENLQARRKLAIMFAIGLAVLTGLSVTYFILPPTTFLGLALLLTVIDLIAVPRT